MSRSYRTLAALIPMIGVGACGGLAEEAQTQREPQVVTPSGDVAGPTRPGSVEECGAVPHPLAARVSPSVCAPSGENIALFCEHPETCPVAQAFVFRCASAGYGPWVVTNGPERATAMFVTNSGAFSTHLFRMGSQGAIEEEFAGPTAATNALASDRCGRTALFAGEMPGIQLLEETGTGWAMQEAVPMTEATLALPNDARLGQSGDAFTAYYELDDSFPRLATRQKGRWETTLLAHKKVEAMGMDLDRSGRPWTAWLQRGDQGFPELELMTPTGEVLTAWTASSGAPIGFWPKPQVLADGLTGDSTFPTLAILSADGLHIVVPDRTGSRWTDQVFSDAAAGSPQGDCPSPSAAGDPCAGKTTCSEHLEGTRGGFGVVRTSAGRSFAAWIHATEEVSYALADEGGPACVKTTTSHTQISGEVVIAELGTRSSERFRVPLGPSIANKGTSNSTPSLSMTARGNSLLMATAIGNGSETEIVYLDVDSEALR